MQLEAKIVWTDDDSLLRWEVFLAGHSQGKYATISEAALLLRDKLASLVQSVVTSET
jgi:hypothetical protein